MSSRKIVEWLLRIGVFIEFLGHGLLAIAGEKEWIDWIVRIIHVNVFTATSLLFFIGITDILVALTILLKPYPIILLWAGFWGFFTALIGVVMGNSWLDFVEHSTNWIIPISLFFLLEFYNSFKHIWQLDEFADSKKPPENQ